MSFHNILYGITSDRIDPTAEGSQLNKLQIRADCSKAGCTVHPGMVGPLINNSHIPFAVVQMADRIFCQHGESHPGYHIRYPVINLRIGMIRVPAEQDSFGSSIS
ncbi:hypothetical protein D3C75_789630 [compost metagenome]